MELLPTVHEGATVRAMEKKGIRTDKGEFNRWIKATNALIRQIRSRLSSLLDWVKEVRAELATPQSPDLVSLLNSYYAMRGAKSYSRSGKVANLKEFSETVSFLQSCELYTLDDLEARVSAHRENVDGLKKTLHGQTARMKEIRQLYDNSAAFQSLKPVYDGLQKIKFEKPRAKYMVVIMLPFIFFALYEKDGQPAEKILGHVVKSMFLRDKVRPYRTNNLYSAIQRQIKEQEELQIGKQIPKGK